MYSHTLIPFVVSYDISKSVKLKYRKRRTPFCITHRKKRSEIQDQLWCHLFEILNLRIKIAIVSQRATGAESEESRWTLPLE